MLYSGSGLRRAIRGGLRRRPSGAMAVALVAMFAALSGGAAYAATSLGKNSVRTVNIHGSAVTNPKIANNAVTYNKIKPSSVGVKRIVKSMVQLRLQNTCPTGQAMSAVDVNGKVTCSAAMSPGTSSAAADAVALTSPTTAATVSTLALGAGSAYQVQANPYITVTPSTDGSAADQHVVVTCTLKAGTTTSLEAQRSASFDLPAAGDTPAPQVQTASIPLLVMVPTSTAAEVSDVSCVSSVMDTSGSDSGKASAHPATATAAGQIYATQLASATTPTTTTPTTTTTTTTTTSTTPAP